MLWKIKHIVGILWCLVQVSPGALLCSDVFYDKNTKYDIPDSKVHGANMGPPGSYRPQMGAWLAPWSLQSGMVFNYDNVLCSTFDTAGVLDLELFQWVFACPVMDAIAPVTPCNW